MQGQLKEKRQKKEEKTYYERVLDMTGSIE